MADGDAPSQIAVGRLTAPHGVKGLMRLQSYTEHPENILTLPLSDRQGQCSFALQLKHPHPKGGLVVAVEGCQTREAAEALRGTELFAPHETLYTAPEHEDEFYIVQLSGLAVRAPDGTALGTVKAVHNFGAGDIVEITPPDGASFMAPFTRTHFPEIAVQAGYVVYVEAEIM
jgi:16S rRNA processing protein RimM